MPPTVAREFEADLVIVNARVRTMDAKRPEAEAVAVFGNRLDGHMALANSYALKLADFVILTENIFRVDPAEIEKVRVRMTIMDGRVVYEAKN